MCLTWGLSTSNTILYRKKYKLSWDELYDYFINKVTCHDINEESLESFFLLLIEFFKLRNVIKVKNDFKNIILQDFLFNECNQKYDLCIWNPPYIRTKKIEESYLKRLRKSYKTCKSWNIDIYYAFFEKAILVANRVVYITPNSLLLNNSAKETRNIIKTTGIEFLIDFKDYKVFEWIWAYCLIISLNSEKIDKKTILYSNSLDSEFIKTNINDIFITKKNNHNIEIYSGIATLADSLYSIKLLNGNYYTKNNIEIDKELIVPLYKLTKFNHNWYILFPYTNKKILDLEILSEKYTKTYNYLLSIKNVLNNRDKWKTEKYDSWYAYGRKQWFNNIKWEKVIIIPKMISNNNKPFEVELNSLYAWHKQFLFTSWYIISWYTDLEKLFILSDIFIDSCRKYWKAFPWKNFSYYSISKTILDTIFSNI